MGEYDIVVTNPPYRDSGTLADDDEDLPEGLLHPRFQIGYVSAFIEKCLDLDGRKWLSWDGYYAILMFISSHEKLRKLLLEGKDLVSGTPRTTAFRSIGGEIQYRYVSP